MAATHHDAGEDELGYIHEVKSMERAFAGILRGKLTKRAAPTPQQRAMGPQAGTLDWQDTPIELFEEPTQRGGVIRLEKWPEGYVLWYHGAIVWSSCETVPR